jgi:hypothetical protein
VLDGQRALLSLAPLRSDQPLLGLQAVSCGPQQPWLCEPPTTQSYSWTVSQTARVSWGLWYQQQEWECQCLYLCFHDRWLLDELRRSLLTLQHASMSRSKLLEILRQHPLNLAQKALKLESPP